MLTASIKRLTKPKFRHEFTTFYHHTYFQVSPLTTLELEQEQANASSRGELETANDISYDGIDSESALNYNSSFGKIFTGE